jgi:hypothetical protein
MYRNWLGRLRHQPLEVFPVGRSWRSTLTLGRPIGWNLSPALK